jgi:threonyl-tRNA synthetase
VLRAFGFQDFQAYLSTRNPEKFAGSVEDWEAPTEALRQALERAAVPYKIDEGEAVFYGPKIDIKVTDALGREWQLSTIQFDFNMPERFDISYIGEDGGAHRPYMVHRALMGSLERFMGVLIEHYAGAFPLWLAPVQAVLVPITDRHLDYAFEVAKQLKAAGIRCEVDDSSNRMNAKIRAAQKQKIPYMLVVGDQEVEAGQVAPRLRSGEKLEAMSVADFIARTRQEIADHK